MQWRNIKKNTATNIMKKFGLLGKSLKHSFSPDYFNNKFQDLSFNDHSYDIIEMDDLNSVRSHIETLGLNGFNVTIPYKEEIITFLDELSDEAKIIGAVNCVHIKNGKWIGYNTDAIGFGHSIKPFLHFSHERALILGSGGASKAIIYQLEKLGLKCLVVSREPNQNQIAYKDLNEFVFKHHPVIVNTTPVGMFPQIENSPAIPYEHISSSHFCIDLIYNPEMTQFLQKAKENNAMILNGKDMLYWQAEKSWEIWNQKE